ncbi:MAG: uracil-DNA glycosylase [Prosthecobacter sp.]
MSNEAAGLLKHYLEQRVLAGQTHVALRPGLLDQMQGRRQPAAQPLPQARPAAKAEPKFERTNTAPAATFERPAPRKVTAIERPALIEVSGNTNAEKLAALAAIAETSPQARALGTLRDIMVFAVGNPDAQIMLIGEAPGYEEEQKREPFVGPAGQKLTGILTAMGLQRSDVYISNICKFRPATAGDQGTSNRAPTDVEMAACQPFILTEISIVAPRVIIALGATACKGLGIGEGVTRLRGKFYDVQGIPTMVTYHPSYILREERLAGGGLRAKREVWEDMLKVMEKTGMAISDKQRGYFKK